MPVFTAAAAYIAATVGVTSAFGIAAINFGVRVLASYVISSLIGNRANDQGQPSVTQDPGSRVQLPPATDNKLPVIYGGAFVSPVIIDAKISTDQTTMWYVMALSEHTDTGTFSFGRAWWGDKELFFDDVSDHTKVTKWINGSDQENTNVSGNLYVYYYGNGSSDPINTTLTAIQVLSDSNIDPSQRWGVHHLMSNTCFAIVKIIYNQDANLTGLEQFKVQINNTLNSPGLVIKDYLTNTRYGCAIPVENVNVDSLEALDTYSSELIPYITTSGSTANQARYTINGPLSTNSSCLTNLQALVDSCDSWLQWDETSGKWGVVINRSYLDYTTYDDLFVIDSSNIVGGIDVTPVDLNSTYNSIEGQYPNAKIKDQTDYVYISIDAEDMNPNEPENKLVVQYPIVNTLVQAKYLATRRLIQSREDLIISITMDYSGIQVQAGDVVRVRHPVYGWGPIETDPENPDKLFRVNQVTEAKIDDGSLGAKLSLVEYNDQVYQNISIHDFTPESNTGIPNPGWIGTPGAPTVTNATVSEDGQIASFTVSGVVPSVGTVLYMDFYYGSTSDSATHRLYRTVTPNTGRAFTAGQTVTITVNDLPAGTYYWSIKARNAVSSSGNASSQSSPSSDPQTWGGMKLLLPALIGSALLGGIGTSLLKKDAVTYDKMAPGAIGAYEFVTFSPDIDGVPIDVTSVSVWDPNTPAIIPGLAVASDQIFPWYQGTNPASTGPWLPTGPGPTAEGMFDDTDQGASANGWWKIAEVTLGGITLTTGETSVFDIRFSFLADAPCTIQITQYTVFEGYLGQFQIWDVPLTSLDITTLDPYPVTITQTQYSGVDEGVAIIIKGYAIRNMTPGTNLTVWGCSGVWRQIKTV